MSAANFVSLTKLWGLHGTYVSMYNIIPSYTIDKIFMFYYVTICQPHGLVSRKNLRSLQGHSFCLGKPQNLISFAIVWIFFPT